MDKTILLGVTGSIAAYKAVELASRLTQLGEAVDVVMSDAATKFVTPLTFRAITHRQVYVDMWAEPTEVEIEHIALADRAKLVVIAPATASTIARLAAGSADNLLLCSVLATRAPVLIAPAMNVNMYENRVTQENIAALRQRGFGFVEPGSGTLACGAVGAGRLAETPQILAAIEQALGLKHDLADKRIVVTAGGTQEPIDPVRHITNRSSGKMGYALAEAARDRGAQVVLISGPSSVPEPPRVEMVRVRTAMEMREAVQRCMAGADILIMAAAVADYRPAETAQQKLKKEASEEKILRLVRNPDIISEVKGDFLRVGFAAESEDVLANAAGKLKSKGLDLIVANDIKSSDSGFDVDTNRVTLIDRTGCVRELPLLPKKDVAHRILDRVLLLVDGTARAED